jgi:hypothetical protein
MYSHEIVRANVTSLMRYNGLSAADVQRLSKQSVQMHTLKELDAGARYFSLKKLDDIARFFRVQSWELLVPNLDPGKRPLLTPNEPGLKELLDQALQVRRYAIQEPSPPRLVHDGNGIQYEP